MDKEKKSEYNKRYYEAHKAQILESRKNSDPKDLTAYKESRRKASRDYYHRKVASETPEQREARNAKRRESYKSKKLISEPES